MQRKEEGQTAAAEALVEKLGRALHRFGSPAHRLEEALDQVASRLGLRGQFFSTPTAIFAAFKPGDPPDASTRTVLLRVEPGEVNLEKLSRLDALLGRVMRGEVEPLAAASEVDAITSAPVRYGPFLTVLAFGLASGSAARFFGGGVLEGLVAAGLGLQIGALALWLDRFPNAGRLFEAAAATLAAAFATVAAVLLQTVSFSIVTLAALVVLVPGLTLTVAMTELATRHLVSGSARLAGALLLFMTIGVGFACGRRGAELLLGAPPSFTPGAQPLATEVLALAISAAGLLVLFRAQPRDYGWFLLAAGVALGGSRAGTALLGPQLGALLGALVVGLGSNLFARLCDRPAAITQLPGLMLLVPGSLGFRSVTALFDQDTLSGLQSAFAVGAVAIALATGLLVTNVLLPPRRVL